MSVCVSDPTRVIVDDAQTVRVLVFCHKIDCISVRTSNCMIGLKLKQFYCVIVLNVSLLRIIMVESQIDISQKDFIGKSNASILVSEIAILPQNWFIIAVLKK